jgi:inosine/xanthosine triphosphatase
MSASRDQRPVKNIEIAVGSLNPAKIGAVERAAGQFLRDVKVLPVEVFSSVPEQPWGDEQTALGAEQRARDALKFAGADLGVGVESGVTEGPGGRLYAISWAFAVDQNGRTGICASERFPLPEPVAVRMFHDDAELGSVIDEVLPNTAGRARLVGAVNVVTASKRDRMDLLTIAVVHALADLFEPWRTD